MSREFVSNHDLISPPRPRCPLTPPSGKRIPRRRQPRQISSVSRVTCDYTNVELATTAATTTATTTVETPLTGIHPRERERTPGQMFFLDVARASERANRDRGKVIRRNKYTSDVTTKQLIKRAPRTPALSGRGGGGGVGYKKNFEIRHAWILLRDPARVTTVSSERAG